MKEHPNCPLSKSNGETRDNPRNAMAAHAVQIHDTAVVLWQCAHASQLAMSFWRELDVLKSQIAVIEQGRKIEEET